MSSSTPMKGVSSPGVDESEDHDRNRIVRYQPSEIKVEKQEGMKTASAFCSSRKASDGDGKPQREFIPHQNRREVSQLQGGPLAASDTASAANDSDFSDNFSVVSDLSDLSIMSLHHYVLPSDPFKMGSSSHSLAILPEVHGSDSGKDGKQQQQQQQQQGSKVTSTLLKKRLLLQNEKEALQKRTTNLPSQKLQIARLQEANFALQRENVNLRSQVELLQQHQKSAPAPFVAPPSVVEDTKEVLNKLAGKSSCSEHRAQLRSAQDEILRLQNEAARKTLEVVTKSQEAWGLKEKLRGLQEELSSTRQRLKEMKEGSASVWSHNCSMQSKVSTLEEDLESAVKSRDWYQEQLEAAKEWRSSVQERLVETHKEGATKGAAVVRLEGELEAAKEELQREKEEFAQKLRKIELEMAEQEAQLDQIQGEKDAVISELTERLSVSEGDVRSVHVMAGDVRAMEASVERLQAKLQAKDRAIEDSKEAIAALEARAASLGDQLSDLRDRLAIAESSLDRAREDAIQARKSKETLSADVQKLKGALSEKEFNYVQRRREWEAEKGSLLRERDEASANLECRTAEVHSLRETMGRNEEKAREEAYMREKVDQERLALLTELETSRRSLEESSGKLSRQAEELESRAEENGRLSGEVEELRAKVEELERARSPSPDLGTELAGLRRQVLRLEQFENEASELRQAREELEGSRAALAEKLMEAEKAYEKEIEEMRAVLAQREEVIEAMRRDVMAVEEDLDQTKRMLDAGARERERADSEQRKRTVDLEEALVDLEEARKKLGERDAGLADAEDRLEALQAENEALAGQLDKVVRKGEAMEQENQRLRTNLEEEVAAGEECRELQAQKLSRLESFTAEYEREVEELCRDKARLQEQIIALEDVNGRLQGESVLNGSLRDQVRQLQRDLKSDTSLRQELVRSIELAKSDLGGEIAVLEEALAEERKARGGAEKRAMEQEQEAGVLRAEGAELRSKVETLEGDLIQGSKVAREDGGMRSTEEEEEALEDCRSRLREMERLLEEKRRSACGLEDHVATLKFSLRQREAEVEEVRALLRAGSERQEAAAERARDAQEALRMELADQRREAEALAQERANYRAQVQQMNLALRNGLEHIRQLRTKASCPGSPSTSSAASSHRGGGGGIDDPFGLLPDGVATPPAKNLSNLQSCLASLKAEMALLQSRLAPGAGVSGDQNAGELFDSPSRSPLSGLLSPGGDCEAFKEDQEAT